MEDLPPKRISKRERRVQAVLALFRGVPVEKVVMSSGICRSDLYKFRSRARLALNRALDDQPRGPKQSHNRISPEMERQIMTLCLNHPTWSAAQVREGLGPQAPSARTILRVRKRLVLPRLPKRAPPRATAHRLSSREKAMALKAIRSTPHLGPQRLSWDLCNRHQVRISPSTFKRMKRARRELMYPPPPPPPPWRFYERHHPHSLWHGDCMEKVTLTDLDEAAHQLTLLDDYSRGYVYCDLVLAPDQRSTIQALIVAMRQWQVIPNTVIFDNAQMFSGKLLSAFCANVGFRLTHTAVRHPQTNGKLERSFRDDMRDFYQHYEGWYLDTLRQDLPRHVHYRNEVRGHLALNGQPAMTRLRDNIAWRCLGFWTVWSVMPTMKWTGRWSNPMVVCGFSAARSTSMWAYPGLK